MEYKPVTRRVTKKSPLETAFRFQAKFDDNVTFIEKVFTIADPEYSIDRELINRIKYINFHPLPAPISDNQKIFIEPVLLMDKALSLVNRKVIVFVPNYVCDSLICNDPDKFETMKTGFFNAFDTTNQQSRFINIDPKIKLYKFSDVDTIIVREDDQDIGRLSSCLTANPQKCQILMVRINPENEDKISISFTGVVSGTSSKLGTFTDTFTGTVSGESLNNDISISFKTFRTEANANANAKAYNGNINGFSPKLGSFRTKVNIVSNQKGILSGTVTGTSNILGAITGTLSITINEKEIWSYYISFTGVIMESTTNQKTPLNVDGTFSGPEMKRNHKWGQC